MNKNDVISSVLEEIFYNLYVREIYKTGEAAPKPIALSTITIIPDTNTVDSSVLDEAKACSWCQINP